MLITDRQWGNWLHCLLDINFTNNRVIKLTMSYYLSITTVITIFSKIRNKTAWRTELIVYNTSLLIYFLLKFDSLRFCSVLFQGRCSTILNVYHGVLNDHLKDSRVYFKTG